MNYLKIINAILVELNYSTVASFAELTKSEHKKIMNILNRLNKDICNKSPKFHFRQRVKKIQLYKRKTEYSLGINGRISKVVGPNGEYSFEPDYTKFYGETILEMAYSYYGNKFLFSPSENFVTIFYSTDDFVMAKNEELKSDFTDEDDKSILPDNFAEKLLVNGVAYNFKQNASHPKYAHWKQEYESALSDLLFDAKKVLSSEIVINGGYRKL